MKYNVAIKNGAIRGFCPKGLSHIRWPSETFFLSCKNPSIAKGLIRMSWNVSWCSSSSATGRRKRCDRTSTKLSQWDVTGRLNLSLSCHLIVCCWRKHWPMRDLFCEDESQHSKVEYTTKQNNGSFQDTNNIKKN